MQVNIVLLKYNLLLDSSWNPPSIVFIYEVFLWSVFRLGALPYFEKSAIFRVDYPVSKKAL